MNEAADPDEPTFIVRASDDRMITIMRLYVELARLDGDERMAEAVEAKIRQVCRWQIENGCKRADL